ncbi:MAG: nitrite reductase (NADH) large subunit [Paracoccaceae bacterium]
MAEKVRLNLVKQQIVEDLETRKALAARFEVSQSVYRKAPYAERATAPEARRLQPLADLSMEAAQ